MVVNRNWEDVTVYDLNKARLGRVQGMTEASFKTCRLLGQRPIFRLRGISFDLFVRGIENFMGYGSQVLIEIGQRPESAFVIGE